jgi:Type IV secretion system pilin
MKKLILITLSTILIALSFSGTALAAACEKDTDCTVPGERCITDKCLDPIEIMLERPGEYDDETIKAPVEVEAVSELPSFSLESGFKTAMKTILGASMILTIVGIVFAGVYYMISQGNDEDISKAKSIILYLIIGMAIMAAAYGIVTGVIQFDFFKAK